MNNPRDDLANRRVVWDAMSELYLDTQLEVHDHERIARVLNSSAYSLDELDRIMFGEVYPVLIANLWSVAGEWGEFDTDGLQSAVLDRLERRFKYPAVFMPGRYLVRGPWNTVKQMAARLPASRSKS